MAMFHIDPLLDKPTRMVIHMVGPSHDSDDGAVASVTARTSTTTFELSYTPPSLFSSLAILLFFFSISGSCPHLFFKMTRLATTTAVLSTQLPVKRSFSLHKILPLSAPTAPTDITTRTSSLPQRRKSKVFNSLLRHTAESLLLPKWPSIHARLPTSKRHLTGLALI